MKSQNRFIDFNMQVFFHKKSLTHIKEWNDLWISEIKKYRISYIKNLKYFLMFLISNHISDIKISNS
mgnify:CR=1 FL=1